jgi:DNA repair photolyase
MKGRGTDAAPPNRYDELRVELEYDDDNPPPEKVRTVFYRDTSRTILAENSSPDVGFRWSLNPYRGCEHGCVYCVGPDTPILHADMTWRPIGDVQVGDALFGFDEFPVRDGANRRTRKLRPAVVEAVWWSKRPTVRLVTEHAEVVTTAEHRWLQASAEHWSPTERLSPGGLLRRLPMPSPASGEGAGFGRNMSDFADPIRAIEGGERADVVDIQTSTGTFVAAGLATHNCYARPSHEQLGFNAGIDFETRIMVKPDAPELLRKTFLAPRWQPEVVSLSGNTDCYQPVERSLGITRRCLEVFAEFRNPVGVITKSALVARDADLLAELARHGAAHVFCSVTTLDADLAAVLEPRTARPHRRLDAVATLAAAGVPVAVMIGPVIPGLNDEEIPRILDAARKAGAHGASWVMLRLAPPLDQLFERWLDEHFPAKKSRVLNRIRDVRGGRLSDSTWFQRQRGRGEYADQIAQLFEAAARKHGLDRSLPALRADAFRRPAQAGDQLRLL